MRSKDTSTSRISLRFRSSKVDCEVCKMVMCRSQSWSICSEKNDAVRKKTIDFTYLCCALQKWLELLNFFLYLTTIHTRFEIKTLSRKFEESSLSIVKNWFTYSFSTFWVMKDPAVWEVWDISFLCPILMFLTAAILIQYNQLHSTAKYSRWTWIWSLAMATNNFHHYW